MRGLAGMRGGRNEYHLQENYPHSAGARLDRDYTRCALDWRRTVNSQQLEKRARRAAGFALAAIGLLTTGPILLRVHDQLK